jgi:hypothetical protein
MARLAHFAAAVVLVCELQNINDLAVVGKNGWLIKCRDSQGVQYLPYYPKRKQTAIKKAKEWLEAHRPKFLVSVEQLRAKQ